MLGPPTSHVLSLHRGGALGGAAGVLEASLAVKLKVLLEVRQTQLMCDRRSGDTRYRDPTQAGLSGRTCENPSGTTPSLTTDKEEGWSPYWAFIMLFDSWSLL